MLTLEQSKGDPFRGSGGNSFGGSFGGFSGSSGGFSGGFKPSSGGFSGGFSKQTRLEIIFVCQWFINSIKCKTIQQTGCGVTGFISKLGYTNKICTKKALVLPNPSPSKDRFPRLCPSLWGAWVTWELRIVSISRGTYELPSNSIPFPYIIII